MDRDSRGKNNANYNCLIILLLSIPAHPVLLIAGPAIPPSDLVAGSLAEAIDQGEDDPAVVPYRMVVGKPLVEIRMRCKAHEVKRVAQI
jgi:hypothetical protein